MFNKCDKRKCFLAMDLYRRPFQFNMPESPSYRTVIGSILSLFTVSIILFYASYKAILLKDMKDYTVNKATHEYFFKSDFAFS